MQLRNCDTGSANREAGLTKKPVPRATDSEGFDTWVSTSERFAEKDVNTTYER